jgi:hypothetical protein
MDKTLFSMRKGTDDQYHLVGKFSNRWRDWDFHSDPLNGGEIVSKSSHREFERWLDKNPQHSPELWTWHTWGTARKSRAVWWAFTDNSFYADWPLTEEEYNAIAEWSKEENLGMSFGFYVFDYDGGNGVINKYRMFEASVLPVASAANRWTSISLIAPPDTAKEVSKETSMAINKKKYAALVKLHGQEYADKLVADDEALAKALDEAGVDTKEDSAAAIEEVAAVEEPSEETAAPPTHEEEVAAREVEVLEALRRLQEVLGKDMQTIVTRMESLEARVRATEEKSASMEARAEAEAKAAATPPGVLAAWMPRSILESEAPVKQQVGSAVVDGRSTLAKSAPAAPSNGGGAIGAFLADIG